MLTCQNSWSHAIDTVDKAASVKLAGNRAVPDAFQICSRAA